MGPGAGAGDREGRCPREQFRRRDGSEAGLLQARAEGLESCSPQQRCTDPRTSRVAAGRLEDKEENETVLVDADLRRLGERTRFV